MSGKDSWFLARRAPSAVAALLALVVALGGTLAASLASSPAASAMSTSAATKQIKSDWMAFFSGKSTAAQKIALLQNGTQFRQIIDAQSKSPLAKSVSATVSSVKLNTKTSATVKYTILEAGHAVLKDQTGTAVDQRGKWKVGTGSFCALLALEQVKTPACPTPKK